jgi:hypothetical protein
MRATLCSLPMTAPDVETRAAGKPDSVIDGFYDWRTMAGPERPETEVQAAKPAPVPSVGPSDDHPSAPARRSVSEPVSEQSSRNGGSAGRTHSRSADRGWVQRSALERRSSPRLELVAEGVVVLNDRRVPGSRLSIDLIAVSPAGVFVIESKNYKGLVHTKRLGPVWNLGPHQLLIGRRNCTASIEDVTLKGDVVRGVLKTTPWGRDVPVRAVLCLTRADWGFASAVEVNDVLVGWPKLIAGKMKDPVVMDSSTVREVSDMIAERLPTG